MCLSSSLSTHHAHHFLRDSIMDRRSPSHVLLQTHRDVANACTAQSPNRRTITISSSMSLVVPLELQLLHIDAEYSQVLRGALADRLPHRRLWLRLGLVIACAALLQVTTVILAVRTTFGLVAMPFAVIALIGLLIYIVTKPHCVMADLRRRLVQR